MTTQKIPRENNKGKEKKTPLQGGRTICARSVEQEQPSLQNHLNPMPNKIKTHHHTLLPDTEDRSATTPMPNKRENTEKRLFKGTSAIGLLKRAQKDIVFAREKTENLQTFYIPGQYDVRLETHGQIIFIQMSLS